MTAESRGEGKGSTFIVVLPLQERSIETWRQWPEARVGACPPAIRPIS
jgi:hypothetical protein